MKLLVILFLIKENKIGKEIVLLFGCVKKGK